MLPGTNTVLVPDGDLVIVLSPTEEAPPRGQPFFNPLSSVPLTAFSTRDYLQQPRHLQRWYES